MLLTFEHTKDWGPGKSPIFTHLADDTIIMFYQEGGDLKARSGKYVEYDPNLTELGDPVTVSTDPTPTLVENIKLPGGQNWMGWKSGTKQRVALYPESPKIMKEAFIRGMLLGVHLRRVAMLKGAPLGEIKKLVPVHFKDENNDIDFWNGYTIGITL